MHMVVPTWGSKTADAVERAMHLMYHTLLVMPVYATAMSSSSGEYRGLAEAALAVNLQRRRRSGARAPTGSGDPSRGGSGLEEDGRSVNAAEAVSPTCSAVWSRGGISQEKEGGGGGMDEVAQELFRIGFFLVLYVEVWLLSHIPVIGEAEPECPDWHYHAQSILLLLLLLLLRPPMFGA